MIVLVVSVPVLKFLSLWGKPASQLRPIVLFVMEQLFYYARQIDAAGNTSLCSSDKRFLYL